MGHHIMAAWSVPSDQDTQPPWNHRAKRDLRGRPGSHPALSSAAARGFYAVSSRPSILQRGHDSPTTIAERVLELRGKRAVLLHGKELPEIIPGCIHTATGTPGSALMQGQSLDPRDSHTSCRLSPAPLISILLHLQPGYLDLS